MAEQKAKIVIEAEDKASANIGKIQGTLNTLKNFIIGSKIFEFLKDTIKGSVAAAVEQEVALNKLDAVLKSTGNTVGLTRDQILDLTQQLSKNTGIADEVILSGQDMLLTFKNLKGDGFEAASKAVVDMDTVMTNGKSTAESMNGSAIRLGKALNDPIAGLSSLARVGVQFNDGQKAQITQMVKAGDVAGAQKIILKELESQFGGAAETIGNSFAGSLKKAQNRIEEVKEAIGTKLTPALAGMTASLATSAENLANMFNGAGPGASSFLKVLTLNFDRALQVIDTMVYSVGTIGDVFKGIGLEAEYFYLKLKNLTGDHTKEIEENRRQIEKLNSDSDKEIEKIEKAHYKTRQGLLKSFETTHATTTDKMTGSTESSAKAQVAAVKKAEEEKQAAIWYTRAFKEQMEKEFDDGQILMMAQRMERERMSSEEKMALMTAVLNHAGLSIQGQSKIEKMLFDEQMNMENQRLENNKRVNDELVGFSKDLSDAIASEEENKLKAVGNVLKRYLNSQVDAWIAAEVAKATATAFGSAFATFGGSLVALAGQLVGITAASSAAKMAINSVKFHEGGIVGGGGGGVSESTLRSGEVAAKLNRGEMVLTEADQKSLLSIIRGGGGGSRGPIHVNVMLDKKVLGRAIYDLDQKRKAGVL